jgi:hypothetical protein
MPHIPTPYLHIARPPDYVRIVGTTAGLRALLHATLDALLNRPPRQRLTYTAAGTGTALTVEMVTEPGFQYTGQAWREEEG